MAPKEQNSKPSLRMTMAGWEELVRHSDTRVKSDYGRVEEAESLNTLIRTAELCNGQMSFAQLAAPAAEVIAISGLLWELAADRCPHGNDVAIKENPTVAVKRVSAAKF
jgi:hypothetical protein